MNSWTNTRGKFKQLNSFGSQWATLWPLGAAEKSHDQHDIDILSSF